MQFSSTQRFAFCYDKNKTKFFYWAKVSENQYRLTSKRRRWQLAKNVLYYNEYNITFCINGQFELYHFTKILSTQKQIPPPPPYNPLTLPQFLIVDQK